LEPALAQLRRFPHLTVLDVTLTDLERMAQAIQQYHLKPRDALHLAAMEKCNCFDLVSQDDDFDRAPMVRRYTLG
jgi:predicted nucleic acid-binding protein